MSEINKYVSTMYEVEALRVGLETLGEVAKWFEGAEITVEMAEFKKFIQIRRRGHANLVVHFGEWLTKDKQGRFQTYKHDSFVEKFFLADVPMFMQDMVKEFHKTYGQPVGLYPQMLPEDRKELRLGLIKEELEELEAALDKNDPIEMYDACIDLLYVIFGLLVEAGMEAMPGFLEVQRSNMSKLDSEGQPILSRGLIIDGFPIGKVLKGPNYFPPNLAKVLVQQGLDINSLPVESLHAPEISVPSPLRMAFPGAVTPDA